MPYDEGFYNVVKWLLVMVIGPLIITTINLDSHFLAALGHMHKVALRAKGCEHLIMGALH